LPAVLLIYVLPSVGQCPTYVVTLRPTTKDQGRLLMAEN
jgi:hypothetical protein